MIWILLMLHFYSAIHFPIWIWVFAIVDQLICLNIQVSREERLLALEKRLGVKND